MAARIIDGTAMAATIRSEIASRVDAFRSRAQRRPCLAVVLVGERPDSQIYVRNKLKTAGEAGFATQLESLPATVALPEILGTVARLNARPDVDGILVQSPLPETLGGSAMQHVFDTIDPAKDVDGVTPVNVGRLVQNRAHLVACTPAGIIEMLERSDIAMAGAHAVVIGRSEIVGKPVALLLLHRNATVTVCHSRTRDLQAVAASADILVAALGRPGFVRKPFVKPGAAVVDVGINRITDEAAAAELLGRGTPRFDTFQKRGAAVVGDVHPEVAEVAGALTPVPGGVGPLTIAIVLSNTLKAAEQRAPH
jgi:methylenetetrahydrofolate dehydrogenase (NADP+)/methenyltetrahydrofolate cyclohydrolase